MAYTLKVTRAALRELAEKGLDRGTIAAQLNVSIESVRRRAVQWGIPLADMREATKARARGDAPFPSNIPKLVPPPPTPSKAALRLAQFDPVVARALGLEQPDLPAYHDWEGDEA